MKKSTDIKIALVKNCIECDGTGYDSIVGLPYRCPYCDGDGVVLSTDYLTLQQLSKLLKEVDEQTNWASDI